MSPYRQFRTQEGKRLFFSLSAYNVISLSDRDGRLRHWQISVQRGRRLGTDRRSFLSADPEIRLESGQAQKAKPELQRRSGAPEDKDKSEVGLQPVQAGH